MTTANIFGFQDTWNDGNTTFNAINVDVTDTASDSASKLINLEVGGVSQFSVDKSGAVVAQSSVTADGFVSSGVIDAQGNRIDLDADNDTYIVASTDDRLQIFVGGSEVIRLDANATDTFSLDGVGFSPTGAVVGQALGYPNSTTTLEPYTPAGGGDTLAAANETVTGVWTFSNGFEVGNADTTLTRASAGDISVEGNLIYRVGGTDVAVADGGTGASTAGGARAALGVPGSAENETITGDWSFSGDLEWRGEPVAKTLPTIAAMKALLEGDLSDGELVYVKSYGAATGYGGGYLRWDASSTATADDFLVFAPTVSDGTGRWHRTGYTWLSPEMAGALGDSDGTAGNGTDDTAAFRRVGAVLETAKSMALRCEQAGAIYRIYSGVADTADIWAVTGVNGFQWDMNSCTLFADRDIRAESVTVFPFQFDGGSNVRIGGGKLRTRARTIDQTSDVAGMRWFYFTGTGSGVWLHLDCADSVEAVFFQRVSGTDAVTDRWRDIHASIKATRCTYGLALSYSGDDAIIDLDCDGCFRSLLAFGVANPQGVVRSKNHRGGDLKLSAYHTSGGDDCPIIGGDLLYIVSPADHSETFSAGTSVDLACIGVDGATIDGLKIRAIIDSNSAKPERQAIVFGKYLDDGSTADTTTGRGHIVRNVQISLQTRNADATSISGRLVEIFHPTYNGNWTSETIDAFTMHDWVVKGAATNDILLGLNGHTNGPRLVNVNADSDLLTSGTHPEPNSIFLASVNTANVTAALVLGRISNEAGLTSIRATGGVAGRYGSTTGLPTFVLESNQPGAGDFGGALLFENNGAAKFGFYSVVNGQMRVYANGNSSTGIFCANWSAAGHYHPGADSTFDLGVTGTRWRNAYVDDYYATTSYRVGSDIVINGLGAAITNPGAITAYTAATISNPPTQAEVQAVANALQTLRNEVDALRTAQIAHLDRARDKKPSIAT